MGRDKALLSDVVSSGLLDQLQHRGSAQLAGQGFDHSSRLDFWCADMVAIPHSFGDQHDTDLGQQQEAVAHIGGIQHSVDLAQLHGLGTVSHVTRHK